jgi:hypothetical protein
MQSKPAERLPVKKWCDVGKEREYQENKQQIRIRNYRRLSAPLAVVAVVRLVK